MHRLCLVLLLAAVSSSLQAQSAAPKLDVATARWLSGCWEMKMGPSVTQEQWMAPSGGAMIGMARTVVRDSIREWEHMVLGPTPAGLAYVTRPARQEQASFPATVITDTLLVFENPAHDFPQRVLYRRRGADSVVARIEGPRGGQVRGIDFPYARVACPGGR